MIDYLIAIIPAAVSCLVILAVGLKILLSYKNLTKKVEDLQNTKRAFEQANSQVNTLMAQNNALRTQLNDLLTKIDHIGRKPINDSGHKKA